MLLLALDQLAFKSVNHGEEVNAVSTENSELFVIDRVKFDLLIILRLTR
jgi:hypothetical protein